MPSTKSAKKTGPKGSGKTGKTAPGRAGSGKTASGKTVSRKPAQTKAIARASASRSSRPGTAKTAARGKSADRTKTSASKSTATSKSAVRNASVARQAIAAKAKAKTKASAAKTAKAKTAMAKGEALKVSRAAAAKAAAVAKARSAAARLKAQASAKAAATKAAAAKLAAREAAARAKAVAAKAEAVRVATEKKRIADAKATAARDAAAAKAEVAKQAAAAKVAAAALKAAEAAKVAAAKAAAKTAALEASVTKGTQSNGKILTQSGIPARGLFGTSQRQSAASMIAEGLTFETKSTRAASSMHHRNASEPLPVNKDPNQSSPAGSVVEGQAGSSSVPQRPAGHHPLAQMRHMRPGALIIKPARPTGQKVNFKTGEYIVYPAHGVGQITGIEEQDVAGFQLELFVISFIKDKMILKVPTPKVVSVGMRKLSETPVVEKALTTLTGRARVKRTMWSRRAQEYEAKINSGDLGAIAEVVRDLYRSDAQPEQSYSERQLFEAAIDRMGREIAIIRKLTEQESFKLIESQLLKGPRRGAEKSEADGAEGDTESDIEEAA